MTPTKIAIIGTRGHYANVLRDVAKTPRAHVVAFAAGGGGDEDVRPVVAAWRELCQPRDPAAPEPRVFDDFRKMLDATSPDVVAVCGPLELHAATSVAAIDRGIHALTEKPAALTLRDLQRLRDACARRPDVRLAAMMFGRYTPGFYTAWRLIRGGAVGDVRLIDARKSYKLGTRPDYYHSRETYGGTIPWVGSHAIDWVLWLGGHPVESVYATHCTDHNDGNGSLERAAVCLLTLAGGRAASVSIDYFRPDAAPTHGDDWARVVGTAGVMEVRPQSVQLIDARCDRSAGTGAGVDVSCDRWLLADFLASAADCGEGEQAAPLIDTAATLELTEVCLLARQSADEGRVVRFDGRTAYATD